MGQAGAGGGLLEELRRHGAGLHGQDGQREEGGTRGALKSVILQGYARSADPRKREASVRQREVAQQKGDMQEEERRRTAEHRCTSCNGAHVVM